MGQSLEGIRAGTPRPVVRFDTTAASTEKLERYQATVLVDATVGAFTLTVYLPAAAEAEGDNFSFRVAGSTGGVNIHYNATSLAISAGTTTETCIFTSDGYEYRIIEANAD